MKKSRFSDNHIMHSLKRVDGLSVPDVCRELGISVATFYKWRAKFGGMDASLMAHMKELEEEVPAAQKDVRRREDQSRHRGRGTCKKVVRPSHQREMAIRAVNVRGLSIRVACEAFDVSQSCYR